MRKMKLYATHPCTVCGDPTNHKSLCRKHLLLAIKPPCTTRPNKLGIFDDVTYSRSGQRRENVNGFRG